jgi:DNA repair protein RadC
VLFAPQRPVLSQGMTAENHALALEPPRQRLQCFGPDSLTTPEMLALVLGSGNVSDKTLELAQSLLTKHGGLISFGPSKLVWAV